VAAPSSICRAAKQGEEGSSRRAPTRTSKQLRHLYSVKIVNCLNISSSAMQRNVFIPRVWLNILMSDKGFTLVRRGAARSVPFYLSRISKCRYNCVNIDKSRRKCIHFAAFCRLSFFLSPPSLYASCSALLSAAPLLKGSQHGSRFCLTLSSCRKTKISLVLGWSLSSIYALFHRCRRKLSRNK
jgi:hypothetical protein